MNFMEKMKETLNEEFNESVTENGATGYKTTGKAMLDFNYKISSYRNKTEEEIIKDFEKVWLDNYGLDKYNKVLVMQFLFFIRDREEGLGERRLFRIIIKHLANVEPEMVRKVIPIMAEYGRWDDLLELFDTQLENCMLCFICKQWSKDINDMQKDKPISLLSKWLPSINASNKKQKERARRIINYINRDDDDYDDITEATYRKTLSAMRTYIDITEKKMCANKWDKIKYENVPSRANLNYNSAFLRHDEERRREFLGKVEKGEKKIHAGKLYPHDIVHKYMDSRGWRTKVKEKDTTLEELWKALPQKEIENTLVVADGSGSMTSTIGNTNIMALDVANALAIYFAEHNKGQFKDKYITFSENPQYVDLKGCNSLFEKIRKALAYDECANTNIEKVFDLILGTAKKYNLPQEEMPTNILIISDMEFDSCTTSGTNTNRWNRKAPTQKLFKNLEEQYKNAGYKLPRLIFWNVNSRTATIPLKENELGVALVSGFSSNIAEMVMSNELDPLKVLLKKLGTERYEKISEILAEWVDEC